MVLRLPIELRRLSKAKKRWSECRSLQLRKRDDTRSASGNGAAIVGGVAAVKVDADDLGDPGLLHGDAVDDVGLGHGAFAVSDDHELSGGTHLVEELGEPTYVSLVERSVNFVEDA